MNFEFYWLIKLSRLKLSFIPTIKFKFGKFYENCNETIISYYWFYDCIFTSLSQQERKLLLKIQINSNI